MRFMPKAFRSVAATTAGLLLVVVAAPAAAQQDASPDTPEHVTITGLVVDESTGDPLATAVVRLASTDRAVMTDDAGRFRLERVPVGSRTLVFEQLGYTRFSLTQEFAPDGAPLVVQLSPQPVVLEGLEVMVDRFERRREAAGVAVRVLRPEDFRSQPTDLFRAVRTRAGLGLVGCTPRAGVSTWCIIHRGSYVPPAVWVDDRPSMGLEELELYRTDEVYAVEVYRAGRAIRVYTRHYMQNVAMSPRAVRPVWGW